MYVCTYIYMMYVMSVYNYMMYVYIWCMYVCMYLYINIYVHIINKIYIMIYVCTDARLINCHSLNSPYLLNRHFFIIACHFNKLWNTDWSMYTAGILWRMKKMFNISNKLIKAHEVLNTNSVKERCVVYIKTRKKYHYNGC